MSEQIPISPLPYQEFSVVLDGQNCVIVLRQMGDFIFCDLTVESQPILQGAICLNRSPINQYPTPEFHGTLVIVDTLGREHPQYQGLNDRWVLLYDANVVSYADH